MDGIERRGHPRRETYVAIMITPNGDLHSADVLDLSESGARVALPSGWTPAAGTRLRMYFRLDARSEVAVESSVVRVGVDHLGLKFAPAQEAKINSLLSAVAGSE
jgi:hypothetical protein